MTYATKVIAFEQQYTLAFYFLLIYPEKLGYKIIDTWAWNISHGHVCLIIFLCMNAVSRCLSVIFLSINAIS